MTKDPWLKRGLVELQQSHWFDGSQMLQGAIRRAFRYDEPDHARVVISKSVPLFASGNQTKLACDLVLTLITCISRKNTERVYTKLIPFTLIDLRAASLETCVRTICNRIIMEKAFQESEFLSHIHNFILEANFDQNVVSDLYFCYAGLLCCKKDFVSCFETLQSWSQEFSFLTPRMRAYLTLAEINAYEIEDCGKYLHIEEKGDMTESDTYLEIANRIFSAVQTSNSSEFYSTTADYSDLIDPKKDGLLKVLCDGISEILNNKSSSGLFSLFKS
ncbi:MAG: hypothetical protein JSU57_03520 [Candidatus Heimdallarchaeota archaeon]|nr:MAG: hypothetical protein JSU57_03520 [Candidatus Heimdallarchaeota archaeon]